ncbi:cohesin domain-containing protein [Halorubrum sp. T3]|uniref:cohesin domain-containing protein n=1 Tax=Halorubrum sp. T3 TaxID=1194088 RepID=UPI000370C7E2|nr:cohesin domain-containing protein [Halorubrum sp. T3]
MFDDTRHAAALALVLALALAPVAAPVAAAATADGTPVVTDKAGTTASDNALLSQQYAQQSDAPQLRLGSATVNPNDTAVVRVSTDASNVAGYQTNVTFDSSVVQVEGVVGSDDFDDPVVNVNNDEGWVVFTQSGTEGVDEPVLARLRVTAVGDDGDSTDLSFVGEDTAVNDADRASVDVALVGGQVDVAAGDVVANNDGQQGASDGSETTGNGGNSGGLLGDVNLVVVAGGAAALGSAVAGGVFLGKRL